MSDIMQEEAEQQVQEIMFAIVSLLNSFGFTDVRAGNVMRLLGTPEEECAMFDDKVLVIDGDLLDLRDIDEIPGEYVPNNDPGTTLH